MQIIFSALYFLASLFFVFYIFVLLLRLLFQKLGASWYNPISQFVIRFTEPVIRPLRRFIPGFRGFDLSIILLALLLEMMDAWLLGALHYRVFFSIWGVIIIAIGDLFLNLSNIYFYAIIISSLMSWFPLLKNNALGVIAELISRPFINLFHRFIPPISGMDFSPLFALVSLILMNMLIFRPIIALGAALGVKH